MARPLFDDEYTGPRFTYGLRYRPASTAALPAGWILWSDRTHADFAHGTIDFPFLLEASAIAAYQLEEVK